jgi:acetyl esterase/lipase
LGVGYEMADMVEEHLLAHRQLALRLSIDLDPGHAPYATSPAMNLLRFLTACFGRIAPGASPAMLLNLTVPRSGYKVHRDIPYGEGPRHKLDLYVPDTLSVPAPVVLFFYGGGFVTGRKSEYRVVGQALANKGIIAAVADYRLYPDAIFPAFVEDGADALIAVRKLVSQYGGDPQHIFLAGHSAGAYISVMLAADPRYLRARNADPSWIRGVIGIAGVYDFSKIVTPERILIFGGAERPETQPLKFIDGKRPPMLLAVGAKDGPLQLLAIRSLGDCLRLHGSDVEERIYPGIGHMSIMLALAPGFRRLAPLLADIAQFVAVH